MSHLILLSPEEIRELVNYSPETGHFTWKPRPINSRNWNERYAGKQVSTYPKPGTGYALIAFFRRHYYVHQIAWIHFHGEHPPKGMHIDHINGNRTDNRIVNLRLATVAQNIQNQKIHRDNTSGFKGIAFHKPTQKWMSRIKANNSVHYLGVFETKEEAYAAYMDASKRLHGEFSNPG